MDIKEYFSECMKSMTEFQDRKSWTNRKTYAGLVLSGGFGSNTDRLRWVIIRWMDTHKEEVQANWEKFVEVIEKKEVQNMFYVTMPEDHIISHLMFLLDYVILK